MNTTLTEELREAANLLDIAQRYRGAERLRQRAAWVRETDSQNSTPTTEYMKGWKACWLHLTGPIPNETAPAAPKEGTVKP